MVWYSCDVSDACCEPGHYHYNVHCCRGCGHRGYKPEGIAVELADCIIRILDWAGKEGMDMESIINEKMAYNRTRPYRHGGKLL